MQILLCPKVFIDKQWITVVPVISVSQSGNMRPNSFMCFSVFHTLHSFINFQVISWAVKIEVLFKVKEPSSETVKKLLHSSDYHWYSIIWKVVTSWKAGCPVPWINKTAFILNTFLVLFMLVKYWGILTGFCTFCI